MQPRLKEKALVDLEIRGRAWRLLGHNIPVVSVFSKQSNLNPHQTKRKKSCGRPRNLAAILDTTWI